MKNIEKILQDVLSGLKDQNIRFSDLRKLLKKYGFSERIRGSHYIFVRKDIIEIINIQERERGKAKPYQVKQVRNIFLKYAIHREDK